MSHRVAVPLLVASILAGVSCATSPPRLAIDTGVDVPESWTAGSLRASDNELGPRWWQEFLEPDLDRLVEEALEASPTLDVAFARVAAAVARARVAGADALPQVAAAGGAQRQQIQFFALGGDPRRSRFNTHSISLDISWEVDLWGRIRAGEEAAIADAEAANAAYHGARQSLIAAVVEGYFQVRERRAQLRLAERNLTRVGDLAGRVEERYRAGLRAALDLRLVLAEVAATRAAVHANRQSLDAAVRQLEVLLGRYPGGHLVVPGEGMEVSLREIPAGLPSTLLARRPDLVQAERELVADERRWEAARKALLPRLALTGSGGTTSDELSAVLDQDFGVWNLIANLAVPIFDGGRLRARADETEALHDESLATWAGLLLRAFSEVETALISEGELLAQEDALRIATDESAAGLEISSERYFTGVMDILDVLEARRRFFQAQGALLAVQLARIENRLDLYLALGGGYEAPTPEPGENDSE